MWQPWSVADVSDEDYAMLMRPPGYDRELDVVAVAPDGVTQHLRPWAGVAAYMNGWVHPVNRIGDFGPVGIRPAYRRRGLARAALLEGSRRMRERGIGRVCISTRDSNQPRLRLYESVGFRVVNKTPEHANTG